MCSWENYETSGPVFIRENGELRCLNDSSLSIGSLRHCRIPPSRPFPRGFTVRLRGDGGSQAPVSICRRKEHFVFTYTKEGNLRYTAKSLFKMALLFVAENVQHIDSLIGFPEQIAEQLFIAAEEKQKFADAKSGTRALRLFSEAYGHLVLKSLCLRKRHLLVSEKLEEIKMFHDLKSLDLYGCKLGDNHEILPHLTSEALSSLTWLSLGDNILSDYGLRKLTAPIRVMKRGLDCLKLLDLSYNPLSEQAVGYLTCFPALQGLDVSGTEIQISEHVKETLRDGMGLVLAEVPLTDLCHSHCKTRGWAEQVVKQWEIRRAELSKLRASLPKDDVLRFYGRKRFVHEAAKGATSRKKGEEEDDDEKARIHFCKAASSSQKRKREASPPALHPSPLAKQKAVQLTVEDWDLLNSY
ncbi:leucine-rich repeat-containing protein 42 isoform X2 [Brienomyrus brachyistius]|uniref:leucine-rich repeat-containing protein 42 isoform X2 n=1 Tax=Brienomyrus brachyistius TaxID=42636 RepID=UPI0020B21072|nr:leucine-rich repeat-containing protein 42 isoform X2 [Brienomyrus brachyistius]